MAMVMASNEMAAYIDKAPIPNAIDRWGPDGFSYGHDLVFVVGICLVLFGSLVIEILAYSTSSKAGLSWNRWFSVFSIGVFLLGGLLVWLSWDVWVEARGIAAVVNFGELLIVIL